MRTGLKTGERSGWGILLSKGLPAHPGIVNLDQKGRDRHHDNPKVEEKGEALRVLDIETDHFLKSRAIFTRHLPESSEAWDGITTAALPREVLGVLAWNARTRTNEAHFAAEDIDQLGKFIQTGGAEQPSSWQQSRVAPGIQLYHGGIRSDQGFIIILVAGSIGPQSHRAKFVDLEATSALPDPFLAKKHRSWRNNIGNDGHHQCAQRQKGQCDNAACDIKRTFPRGQWTKRVFRERGELGLIAYGMHNEESAGFLIFYYLFII